jgi:hypothetical protein
MIGLEHVMTYSLVARGPLKSTRGSPLGERQYWEMSEGRLTGEGISARIAMPGGDWMLVSDDGFWRPDVRVQFETEDGAVVLLHYHGLVEQTDRFKLAAERNEPTGWDDVNMRMAMRFETGDPRYQWLNRSLFLAEGRLLGTGRIEYRIYRVT